MKIRVALYPKLIHIYVANAWVYACRPKLIFERSL